MPGKPKMQPSEYATFSEALKKVLRVSHTEIMSKLETEKKAKKRRQKSSFSHASSAKG